MKEGTSCLNTREKNSQWIEYKWARKLNTEIGFGARKGSCCSLLSLWLCWHLALLYGGVCQQS